MPLLLLLLPTASADRIETWAALVCLKAEGCPEEQRVLGTWAERRGAQVTSLASLTAAGLAGGDPLAVWRAASPEAALALLPTLPLTVSGDDLFALTLTVGAQRMADGGDADAAFQAAASSSGGRLYDLPMLSPEALTAYADAAQQARRDGALTVSADAPEARIFIDGALAGAAPLEVALPEGWHRVSAEWPDRRRAWTAEVTVVGGQTLGLTARRPSPDHPAAVATAVAAAMRGDALAPELSEALTDWARSRGARLLLVEIQPSGAGEAFVDEAGRAWSLSTLTVRGGGWALEAPREVTSLGWGLTAGPMFSAERGAAAVEAELRLARRATDWTLRLGALQANAPYYLYEDRSTRTLGLVSLGPLVGPDSGPYGGLMALAVVPYALGAQGVLGWSMATAPGRRLAGELRAGATDKGWLVGASVRVGVGS